GVEGHGRNTLPHGHVLNMRPDLDNLPTELVPHHLPRFDKGTGGVGMQVTPTDATGFDTDNNIVRRRLRIGESLHTNGANAFKDCSLPGQLLCKTPGKLTALRLRAGPEAWLTRNVGRHAHRPVAAGCRNLGNALPTVCHSGHRTASAVRSRVGNPDTLG